MTRSEAIDWCKDNLHYWPKTTKFPHPKGWRWVMSHRPYQLPEFKLINADSEEIFKENIWF